MSLLLVTQHEWTHLLSTIPMTTNVRRMCFIEYQFEKSSKQTQEPSS